MCCIISLVFNRRREVSSLELKLYTHTYTHYINRSCVCCVGARALSYLALSTQMCADIESRDLHLLNTQSSLSLILAHIFFSLFFSILLHDLKTTLDTHKKKKRLARAHRENLLNTIISQSQQARLTKNGWSRQASSQHDGQEERRRGEGYDDGHYTTFDKSTRCRCSSNINRTNSNTYTLGEYE